MLRFDLAWPCRVAERGFTLLEMLVVLVILGLMAGLVVPLLGPALPRAGLVAAASEIRAALAEARSAAILQDRTVAFRGDPAGGYWLDRQHHRLAAAADPALRLRIAVAGTGQVAFFAWGGSSGGRVWIEAMQGRRTIDVDAVTGRAVPGR